MPVYEPQNIGMMHNTGEPPYIHPPYGYRQDPHANHSGASSHAHEKLKEEPDEAKYEEYIPPKKELPQPERLTKPSHYSPECPQPERLTKDRYDPNTEVCDSNQTETSSKDNDDNESYSPEVSEAENCCHKKETENSKRSVSVDEKATSTTDRLLRCKRTEVPDEVILARRAALAAAQREVRRRRFEKMSDDERQDKLAAQAAKQKEARKKQRDKMTEEELQIRRTISALTQREVRRRRMSNMTEEELKHYRAREASRQKELRHRKRSDMTEEELKAYKAREAALSAARRARRLGKPYTKACFIGHVVPDHDQVKECFTTGQEPHLSPS